MTRSIEAFREEGGHDADSIRAVEVIEQLTGVSLETSVEEQALALRATCSVSDVCKLRGVVDYSHMDSAEYVDPGMWVDTTIPVVTARAECTGNQCPSDTPAFILSARLSKLNDLAGAAVNAIDERAQPILKESQTAARQIIDQVTAEAEQTILEPANRQAQEILSTAQAQADTYLEPAKQRVAALLEAARQQADVVRDGILGEVMSEVAAVSVESTKLF